MDCDGVHKFMELWLDEEMDASSRQEFSAHIDACGPCRERVQGETRLERAIRDRVLRDWQGQLAGRMSGDTWTRITRRIEREAKPRRWGILVALAVAAAASLVFAGSWLWSGSLHKPDLEQAAIEVQRRIARGDTRLAVTTNSADEVEKFFYDNLGMAVDLQKALSGKVGCHDVKFMGASIVSMGDVECACLSYQCCGEPVTVVLVPIEKMNHFPEMQRAIAGEGSRLTDHMRSTQIEVRAQKGWVACVVGDHPIADLASVFEKT